MKKIIRNLIILIPFMIFGFLLILILIRPNKEVNSIENRMMVGFKDLEGTSLLDNTFQNKLENLISDQLLMSGTIKQNYLLIKSKVNYNILKFIYGKSNCENSYQKYTKSFVSYNCDDYLITTKAKEDNVIPMLDNFLENFNFM